MNASGSTEMLMALAELFAAHRELPELLGKRAYQRAREIVSADEHWSSTWGDLYDSPDDCMRVVELAMAGCAEAPERVLTRYLDDEQIAAAASALADELEADPIQFIASLVDENENDFISFDIYVDALLEKPGVAIGWAFFSAVILPHHLAGDHVYITLEKAKRDDCSTSWERLLRIDPMFVRSEAFMERMKQAGDRGDQKFVKIVARAVTKHERGDSWDSERQFEAAMRDLLQIDGTAPLTYEEVFLLCSKYGGSAFRDPITLRAEAAKTRKRLKIVPRSKNDSE